MIAFALAALALTAAVLVAVLLPLLRGGSAGLPRAAYDEAVFRDQMRELERDLTRGMIGPAEAAAARLEIQRRLLAHAAAEPPPDRAAPSRGVALALAVLVAGTATGFYLLAGDPGLPAVPHAERPETRAAAAMRREVADLERRLGATPADGALWAELGRARAALGEWAASAAAYRHALDRLPATADLLAAHAEALVLAAGGTVGEAARAGFAAALAEEPTLAIARHYLAVADAQAGRHQAAIAAWQALAAELPAEAPIRADLARRVAASAAAAGIADPGLPPPDGPAAAAAQERMIRGMVARLAARLAAAPEDVDGWLRLGRAYAVLGERDSAASAFAEAAARRPGDPEIALAEARALLEGLPPTVSAPPRALVLLRQVLAADARNPTALWHLGLDAAKRGARDEAVALWQRLAAALPPDSQDAAMVRRAIETLRR